MIKKSPIIIICGQEDADFYRHFPFPGEEVLVVPYGQAVCSVLTREIDLVLLDCAFDVSFGLQLLVDLKSRFPRVPVVFVAEQSSEEIVIAAFKSGAREFFQKPLPIFKVRDSLTELLRAKRLTHEHRTVSSAHEGKIQSHGRLCEVGSLQPAVMKVVCYVESNYKELISLQQMANLANMSKYHFVRLFRREVGMTPVRYLKFVRIQRAKELLKRTELSIASTALMVGFQDVSNFNKNFRGIEGRTPSEYRSGLVERIAASL